MHGNLQQNAALVGRINADLQSLSCDLALFVPFPYLPQIAASLSGASVGLGAQTVSEYTAGAFTGEVSASMLVDVGCSQVLVGHSERRSLYGESDAQVAAKFEAAANAGLRPLLCVGETLAEREAGETLAVVGRQLKAVIDRCGVVAFKEAVVAYEPVWAIGTGVTASPVQAQEVHAAIRGLVASIDAGVAHALRLLYGGSVKPQNAAELFAQPDIDGGLIGGASLVAEDFLAICRAAV